jgi:diguanylate cyclase (GGDEF)-like protein/PAS domain S-box-containing protein
VCSSDLLVDASLDAAAVVDCNQELLYFNTHFLRLSGLRRRALVGKSIRGICHTHFQLDACAERCVALRALEQGRTVRVDEVSSGAFALRLNVVAVPLFDDAGEVFAVMEHYRDVTAEGRLQENYRRLLGQERAQKELLAAEVARQTIELEAANKSLRAALGEVSRVARTDGLTGLANRRHFDEMLVELIHLSEVHARALSLVLFDLDHFKRINDQYGHPAGDRLLQDFATCLRASAREGDFCARVGGEEFAVVLPGAGAADGVAVAERVREQAVLMGLMTTASAGVAAWPEDGPTASELLRSADRALYHAKGSGRNRVSLATDLKDRPADPATMLKEVPGVA